MSGAAQAVQRAMVTALSALDIPVLDGLAGVPALPVALVADGTSLDWSTKDRRGREHRVALAILADADQPAMLHALLARAEDAIEAMPRDLPGHRIASLVLLRSRIDRDRDGVWAGRVDYRIRTLETFEA